MPAGVTWPRYIKYTLSALVTMFVGAQCVHLMYNPLHDVDQLVEEELERRRTKKME